MASDRPTYPRLNMEKHNATDITLSIGIPWTDKMKALFHDVPMDTGGRFLSFATYKPRGATERHLLREYCHIDDGESGEEGTELHVTVEYTRDAYLPSSRVPRRLNRGGLLLSALARLTDPVSIHCHVAFAFSGEHETTVYPLPAPPGLANLPFDEIRGIRG